MPGKLGRSLALVCSLSLIGCGSPRGGSAESVSTSQSGSRSSPITATGDIFNLHVQGQTGMDEVLALRIVEGLRSDTKLASLLPTVNIDVDKGRVRVRGVVQNEEQKHTIVSVVQRAAGASNVSDELLVQQQTLAP